MVKIPVYYPDYYCQDSKFSWKLPDLRYDKQLDTYMYCFLQNSRPLKLLEFFCGFLEWKETNFMYKWMDISLLVHYLHYMCSFIHDWFQGLDLQQIHQNTQ